MKKLLIGLMLLLPVTAHAQKTKTALTTEVNSNLASGNQIPISILRTTLLDMINSWYDLNGTTTANCASHTWISAFPTLSSQTCTQPAIADISGWGTNVAAALGNTLNAAGGLVGFNSYGTGVATALGINVNSTGAPLVQPSTTRAGDIFYWNGSTLVALAGNNSGTQVFSENASGVPAWITAAGSGTVTSAQIIGAGLTVNSGTCTITSTGVCTLTTPAAVKSDMITGSSTTLAVTPGEMSFSPYSMKVHGLLVISGGTTATLQPGSAGISSVAYTSTGQYKVNFSTAFANSTYDCTTSATGGSTSAFLAVPGQTSYTASQVSITVLQATAFGVADPSAVSIQCAGLQ